MWLCFLRMALEAIFLREIWMFCCNGNQLWRRLSCSSTAFQSNDVSIVGLERYSQSNQISCRYWCSSSAVWGQLNWEANVCGRVVHRWSSAPIRCTGRQRGNYGAPSWKPSVWRRTVFYQTREQADAGLWSGWTTDREGRQLNQSLFRWPFKCNVYMADLHAYEDVATENLSVSQASQVNKRRRSEVSTSRKWNGQRKYQRHPRPTGAPPHLK